MAINCKACQAKDAELSFLRELVKDIIIPKGGAFTPTFVDELGKIQKLDGTEEKPMTDEDVQREINEILSH